MEREYIGIWDITPGLHSSKALALPTLYFGKTGQFQSPLGASKSCGPADLLPWPPETAAGEVVPWAVRLLLLDHPFACMEPRETRRAGVEPPLLLRRPRGSCWDGRSSPSASVAGLAVPLSSQQVRAISQNLLQESPRPAFGPWLNWKCDGC